MNRRSGFTLIEVLVFGAIASFLMLCAAVLINKPAKMQQLLASSETPRETTRAMDLMVNDLREAIPGSVQWDISYATSPLSFSKPFTDPQDTSSSSTVMALPMAYGYAGPQAGPGTLVRVEGSTVSSVDQSTPVPTVTAVLSPIAAPTLEAPLFHYDPQLQMVMIDIHYDPPGKPPIRLVRRVALTK